MEGTRHERSAIITVSYIIGFVSAFILYQANKEDYSYSISQQIAIQTEQITPNQQTSQSASLINAQQPTPSITRNDVPFVTSVDGKYTFTCESNETNKNVCTAYIYIPDINTKETVTMDGTPVTMSPEMISDVWWTGHVLNIGEISSADITKPWLLVSEDLPIDLQ